MQLLSSVPYRSILSMPTSIWWHNRAINVASLIPFGHGNARSAGDLL